MTIFLHNILSQLILQTLIKPEKIFNEAFFGVTLFIRSVDVIQSKTPTLNHQHTILQCAFECKIFRGKSLFWNFFDNYRLNTNELSLLFSDFRVLWKIDKIPYKGSHFYPNSQNLSKTCFLTQISSIKLNW